MAHKLRMPTKAEANAHLFMRELHDLKVAHAQLKKDLDESYQDVRDLEVIRTAAMQNLKKAMDELRGCHKDLQVYQRLLVRLSEERLGLPAMPIRGPIVIQDLTN